MTSERQIKPESSRAGTRSRMRERFWRAGSHALQRVAPPYARLRTRQARIETTLQRLEEDLAHVRRRHGEQIERLEELTRELVLAAEALRRDAASRTQRDDG